MFGLRQLPAAVANFKLALMYDPENGDVKQALHIVQTVRAVSILAGGGMQPLPLGVVTQHSHSSWRKHQLALAC
jgi:hypothetical protein